MERLVKKIFDDYHDEIERIMLDDLAEHASFLEEAKLSYTKERVAPHEYAYIYAWEFEKALFNMVENLIDIGIDGGGAEYDY